MEQSVQTDEELMAGYQMGDLVAFSSLYQRYEQRIYSFFWARLRPDQRRLVPDLFQKTWLKVHHGRKKFDPKKSFSPWIFTVALNVLRDEIKSPAEKQVLDELNENALPEVIQEANSPEAALLLKSEIESVQSTLALLPDSQRQAFLLAEYDGLSSQEIASVLGLSDGGVRQLLFRARQRLKSLLSGATK